MALLTKDQILAADRRKTKDVPVREWGGDVRLQEMSGDERDAWEGETFLRNDDGTARFNAKQVRSRLLIRCMVDADGRRLFIDDEVAKLGSLSASTLQRLYNEAMELNKVSADDIEELEGNSGAGPSAGDSSTSANASA